MGKFRNLFILLFAAILLCSCSTLQAEASPKTVSVSGTGSVSVKADQVTFVVSVSETASTTGAAQQEANKKITSILQILRSFGIKDEDITTTSINFSTETYWENGRQVKTGEQVSQSLYIRMKDIDKFASLIDELGSKISGISFNSVSFCASDYSDSYSKARKLAYEDAMQKALIYATSSGLTLGKPLYITDGYTSTGSFRYSNMEAKYAASTAEDAIVYGTEIPSGSLNVTVSCDIVFELK